MSILFEPIQIRGQNIRNRLFVSPMCQYSATGEDGIPTSWHMVHLGSRAVGGAGLVMFEATAVASEGRITPRDLGIWSDEQVQGFANIAEFISEQGAIPAIQLAHAGRKASHDVPWAGNAILDPSIGGWNIVAPSPVPYDTGSPVPHEMSMDEIERLKTSFASAAGRAIDAGIKIIELHFAHGYLICEFMSPLSNKRSDKYGGDFVNRIRLPIEIVDTVRKTIPDNTPLFVRISCSEYVDGGWTIEDSVLLASELKQKGVDLIDCSSGGNSPDQKLDVYPEYQVGFAEQIRGVTGILTGAVGLITDPYQAERILASGQADVILMGRESLRSPYWPLYAEATLNSTNNGWSKQYLRAVPN